ncbi:uncharacterized protein B0H18DRAFT_1116554 [Fomitopsis serialis]|uniref:uncharacterized protein n=1 Tax=Fomitopsis serialis TaxID=139415 RepID=UPI002007B92E|nr:uncharacterized protein B0H18DRAFT_1116554 [Neoantrodia serialis]KAH9930844.1 hypothetical protein B0H18DRAFT_1116554 [Neoantrodia serialis]
MIQSTMSPYYAYVAFALLCTSYACYYNYCSRRRNDLVRLTSLDDIEHLLSPPVSLTAQLQSRALANARLKPAFGIDSTFVNGDLAAHGAFTRFAINLISPRNLPWSRLADIAKGTVTVQLCDRGSIPFDTLVRRLVMYVILVGLLEEYVDESAIAVDDIDLVTGGINELWALSKTSTYRPDLLEEVNMRLRCWLPNMTNPMEIIIPTYETMWRVVAVATALGHDNTQAIPLFSALLQQPTTERYRQCTDDSFSADAFMQEVLRLYPPTRRISRVVPVTTSSILSRFCPRLFTRYITFAADVEALQCDSLWANSRREFDPSRHHLQRSTEQQRKTLLAFGTGKLTCVAKNWAPQAAAIMVAAILDQVGAEKDFALEPGKAIGGREGWEGWFVQRRL